jgi:hypothetical protein
VPRPLAHGQRSFSKGLTNARMRSWQADWPRTATTRIWVETLVGTPRPPRVTLDAPVATRRSPSKATPASLRSDQYRLGPLPIPSVTTAARAHHWLGGATIRMACPLHSRGAGNPCSSTSTKRCNSSLSLRRHTPTAPYSGSISHGESSSRTSTPVSILIFVSGSTGTALGLEPLSCAGSGIPQCGHVLPGVNFPSSRSSTPFLTKRATLGATAGKYVRSPRPITEAGPKARSPLARRRRFTLTCSTSGRPARAEGAAFTITSTFASQSGLAPTRELLQEGRAWAAPPLVSTA